MRSATYGCCCCSMDLGDRIRRRVCLKDVEGKLLDVSSIILQFFNLKPPLPSALKVYSRTAPKVLKATPESCQENVQNIFPSVPLKTHDTS